MKVNNNHSTLDFLTAGQLVINVRDAFLLLLDHQLDATCEIVVKSLLFLLLCHVFIHVIFVLLQLLLRLLFVAVAKLLKQS